MLKCVGLALLLGTTLGSVAWAQGAGKFDGQYVGELTLKGIINGDCTKPPLGAEYPLTISGGIVRFKYVPRFDTTLVGRVDQNGTFKASCKLRSGIITMTGRTDGVNVTASIVSPSCEYSFQTK